jgi:hypothetical protein
LGVVNKSSLTLWRLKTAGVYSAAIFSILFIAVYHLTGWSPFDKKIPNTHSFQSSAESSINDYLKINNNLA